ncbi:MAG: hypothetical protein GX537_00925 [Actinobacteria bacterium]|nr:hypothetical protein [Actinomycetota bacterium]
MTRLLAVLTAAVLAGAVWRRVRRRSSISVFFADGRLFLVPPVSPAGLELRAAAGDVLRAFSTAAEGVP